MKILQELLLCARLQGFFEIVDEKYDSIFTIPLKINLNHITFIDLFHIADEIIDDVLEVEDE